MEGADLCHIPARTIFQWGGVPLKFYDVRAFLDFEFHDHWIGKWCSISRVPSLSRSYSLRFYILEVFERDCLSRVCCQWNTSIWVETVTLKKCVIPLIVGMLRSVGHIRNLLRRSVLEGIIFSHTLLWPKLCNILFYWYLELDMLHFSAMKYLWSHA
jgi:hypothetical protein